MDRGVEVGAAAEEAFLRMAEALDGTEHAFFVRLGPLGGVAVQDGVVVEVDKLLGNPESVRDRQSNGRGGPVVFVVEVAVGAPGDMDVEVFAVEGAGAAGYAAVWAESNTSLMPGRLARAPSGSGGDFGEVGSG